MCNDARPLSKAAFISKPPALNFFQLSAAAPKHRAPEAAGFANQEKAVGARYEARRPKTTAVRRLEDVLQFRGLGFLLLQLRGMEHLRHPRVDPPRAS